MTPGATAASAGDERGSAEARRDGADGRRLRSERSREKIINGLEAVIRSGVMRPNAAEIAEAAGVSLRTVFRHFEDTDGLFRELSTRLEAEIMPIVLRPFEAQDWRGRLVELMDRRAEIYERLMPFKVAAGARRFGSDFLMEEHRRFVALERAGLQALLPDAVLADEALSRALDVLVSFEAWRRMRYDQDLSPAEAKAVMRLSVEKLTEGL